MRKERNDSLAEALPSLVGAMPDIFNYFVPGYVFISVYNHVAWRYCKRGLRHILLSSIVVSFVLKNIFDIVFSWYFDEPTSLYTVSIFLFSIATAYLLAVLGRSRTWDSVCNILKIDRTQSDCIWNDVFKRDAWVRVYLKDGITTYLGQIVTCEENSREPIIILGRYQLISTDGEIIIDNSSNPKEFMILNLRDFERAKLTDI